jgi:hypothetical protein
VRGLVGSVPLFFLDGLLVGEKDIGEKTRKKEKKKTFLPTHAHDLSATK